MKLAVLLSAVILSVEAMNVIVRGVYYYEGGGKPYQILSDDSIGKTLIDHYTCHLITKWSFSMNDTVIAEGTDDFCNPDAMTLGGMAMQILRNSLNLEDEECPFEQLVMKNSMQFAWNLNMEMEDIFNTEIRSELVNLLESTIRSLSAEESGDIEMTLQIKNECMEA